MPRIQFQNQWFDLADNETVLDGLLRQGLKVAHACRSGFCQSCLMKAVEGAPPPAAQNGLKETQRMQNYFLSCQCVPTEDLVVGEAGDEIDVVISGKEFLNHRVVRIRMRPERRMDYRAGQFVQLIREDGLIRPYSLASHPERDEELEMHVLRAPSGNMSRWLFEEAREGEKMRIRGPQGNCFYIPGNPAQPLLLAGTGTGLAPLIGILHDALHCGHTGPIHLFHGALKHEDLYWVEELRALAVQYGNFYYNPCVLQGDSECGLIVGDLTQIALRLVTSFKGWRVFLCGHPDLVLLLRKKIFLKGASHSEIFADAFYAGN